MMKVKTYKKYYKNSDTGSGFVCLNEGEDELV